MRRKSTAAGKIGYTVITLAIILVLSGCGTILAGIAPEQEYSETIASNNGNVTWFDGTEIKSAYINVTRTVELSAMPFRPDLTRVPLSDTTGLRCFQISSNDDISSLYDMQAVTIDKTPIINIGVTYDGAIYPLGSGWYGVILPNGFSEPYYIRIGQTYFEMY